MDTKSKKEIRKEVKAARASAAEPWIRENSRKICETFLKLPEYQEAETVFAYMDCKNEVSTRPVIEQCWKDGKTVAVPKVFGKIMKYYRICSYKDMEEGYYGIPEPKYELLEEAVCEDGLMILPGVAFDTCRHRVGYGGGFYDRYLEAHPDMKKIAFAFEFQVYDEVPFEKFDRQPEKIITEKRIIV
ncbi:MAG: 5-formyltetrahydrofolate cyclo-ligase [Lachnospiraceae bacterium]